MPEVEHVLYNKARSEHPVSPDGRRQLRTRPVELPRKYYDLTVNRGGERVEMTRRHYIGPKRAFYLQERNDIPNPANVFLGDEGGFVIQGTEPIDELCFGFDPKERNHKNATRYVVDAPVGKIIINNGTMWLEDGRKVGHLLVRGPGEIEIPGEISDAVDFLEIEGEGVRALINGKPAESFLSLTPLSTPREMVLPRTGLPTERFMWTDYTFKDINFGVSQSKRGKDNDGQPQQPVNVQWKRDGLVIGGDDLHTLILGQDSPSLIQRETAKPLTFIVSNAKRLFVNEGQIVRVTGKIDNLFGNNGTVILEKDAHVGNISGGLTVRRVESK